MELRLLSDLSRIMGCMIAADKQKALKDFRRIPGVGKSIAEDFWNIGLRSVEELKHGDPEELYRRVCAFQGCHVDRCLLYVLRCAIYFASHPNPKPELLKWWNWKDAKKGSPKSEVRSQ